MLPSTPAPRLSIRAASGKLRPLKFFSQTRSVWKHRAFAVAAGLILAAGFPKMGFAGLAWLAPALILFVATNGQSPFRLGWFAGFTHYLATLRWLLNIPVDYMPIVGWLALSAFLALLPATWVWACAASERATTTSMRRLLWAVQSAALWVALEMLAARIFGGFPWNLLGASQYQMLPLIQIASITGIYGISFLIVWFSVSLLLAVKQLIRQPTHRLLWLGEIALPLTVILLVAIIGLKKNSNPAPVAREIKIALVQPSIPQTMIWNPADSTARFEQLLKLSEAAFATKPDLLLWPEAAVPKLLRFDQPTYDAVTNLARTHRIWMIIGADDAESHPQPGEPDGADYFNSSFLVSPRGELAATYRKRHLVMFGEYVPLIRWFPFIKHLTPITGGFTPGEAVVPFAIPELKLKTSVLICIEDSFPHLVRDYVDDDTDFLVNLTNDGWFGEGAAQWQHAAAAVFRTVENGLPLVRCANNGLTCWIDAHGGLHEIYFGDTRDIHGAGFKTASLPLPAPGPRPATFYRRHGDWFGWGCVVFSVVMVALPKIGGQRVKA